jgi:ABC-type sugar transport system substrate-binding protein
VNSMIAQGVDADLPRAPRGEAPDPRRDGGQAAGIPVILLDRNVDQSLAKAGRTTSPSSAPTSSTRASAPPRLTKAMNGKAKIIQLEGTTGSSPANDRKQGLRGLHQGPCRA